MAEFDYDIGIIGGGAAGLTVASGAAQLGAKTLLIEKEKELGGDCLHFGCVPSKTVIRSAHVYHLMKHADRFGLPLAHVAPVDFSKVSARIRDVIAKIQHHDSEKRFCGLGAKVLFASPRFADEHTVEIDGRRVTAEKWVIATGSSAAVPPIPGLAQAPFVTNREIFYLDKLPESLVILGAGPIGIEMAQAFVRLGSQVQVLDRGPQILPKEDRDMADAVRKVLEGEGVAFHPQASVTRIEEKNGAKVIHFTDAAGAEKTASGDTLLVAAGRKPNTDGLGLAEIGVELDRGYVKVDKRLRTRHRHIFAAGDVNGGFQFTHAAGYEGGIVVSNAVFRLPRKVDYTYLPWCTYTDPELASIGMNQGMAEAAGIKVSVYTEAFENNDRSLAEGERIGWVKLLLDEKEKPVGVQILGPHAGELISEWVAVMGGKVKLSALAGAIHPYPTIAEINKRVTGNYFSPKIFSDTVKKGLKFFFNLKGRACTLEEG